MREIWGDEPTYKVFISHKAEAKKEAAKLKTNLKLYELSCFVAHQDIVPTQEWQSVIETALFSADCLVALMTDKFHDSNWTDQEIGIAYARKIPIIPIRMGTDPYGFIGKFQGLNCNLDLEFKKLISILLRKDNRMVDYFITLVEKSGSFGRSNDLATLLSDIEKLESKQIKRLIDAYKTNSQVQSSIGFRGFETRTNGFKYGRGLNHELKRITGTDYQLDETP